MKVTDLSNLDLSQLRMMILMDSDGQQYHPRSLQEKASLKHNDIETIILSESKSSNKLSIADMIINLEKKDLGDMEFTFMERIPLKQRKSW